MHLMLSSGNCVVAFWEIAARSAHNMFSWYEFSFFPPQFWESEFLSNCAISCSLPSYTLLISSSSKLFLIQKIVLLL